MFLKDTNDNRNSSSHSAHLRVFLHDFLNATLLESATQTGSVRGDSTHRKTSKVPRNLCSYSRVENERCIFFSVQAFRSFKYPLAGYILTNLTARYLAFHLFTFHRKSSVWSEERREVEVILTEATPTNLRLRHELHFFKFSNFFGAFEYWMAVYTCWHIEWRSWIHRDHFWHFFIIKIHLCTQTHEMSCFKKLYIYLCFGKVCCRIRLNDLII